MLIDNVQEIQAIDISGVAWILVIEKEVAPPCQLGFQIIVANC